MGLYIQSGATLVLAWVGLAKAGVVSALLHPQAVRTHPAAVHTPCSSYISNSISNSIFHSDVYSLCHYPSCIEQTTSQLPHRWCFRLACNWLTQLKLPGLPCSCVSTSSRPPRSLGRSGCVGKGLLTVHQPYSRPRCAVAVAASTWCTLRVPRDYPRLPGCAACR